MEVNPTRAEAQRLLGIAEKLLQAKDFNGSRDFAVLAQETEPLLEGSDQILAVVDVLVAAQKRVNNHHDWYSILQIDRRSSADLELIKKQYRRFAFLLHPDKNRFAFSDSAFRIVAEAWAVLSDSAKKLGFDNELNFYSKVDLVPMKNNNQTTARREKQRQDPIQQDKLPVRRSSPWAAAAAPERGSSSGGGGGGGGVGGVGGVSSNFWTTCPYCYNLYEYPRVYVDCCLRCQNCDRAFHAASIPALPPIVPGKEAYHCCWGFFPMGFTVGKGVAEGGGGKKDDKKAGVPSSTPAVPSSTPAVPSWAPSPSPPLPPAPVSSSPPPPPPSAVVPNVFLNVSAVNATPVVVAKKRGRPKKNVLA